MIVYIVYSIYLYNICYLLCINILYIKSVYIYIYCIVYYIYKIIKTVEYFQNSTQRSASEFFMHGVNTEIWVLGEDSAVEIFPRYPRMWIIPLGDVLLMNGPAWAACPCSLLISCYLRCFVNWIFLLVINNSRVLAFTALLYNEY